MAHNNRGAEASWLGGPDLGNRERRFTYMTSVAVAILVLAACTEPRSAPPTLTVATEPSDVALVLRQIITMPYGAIPGSVRGEAMKLAGYIRTTDEETIRYLCSHLAFCTAERLPVIVHHADDALDLFPAGYSVAEIGLPAVPELVRQTATPIADGRAFTATANHVAVSAFIGIAGSNGSAIVAFARDAALAPASQAALSASLAALPRRRVLSDQELLPRTFDLPEPYKLYTDPEELKHALLSEDDATRHAALSGVLRTYKEHAKALTDLIAAEGPAELEVIEAIGQLRPRQEEAVQAVLGELLETVRQDPMDGKHEEALVTALAKIGCPGVRACVNLLKTEEDKRVEKACVRVLWFALGQFGDDWLLAEAQYGDGREDYAERLTAVAERWKRLFKGGGIWNLS